MELTQSSVLPTVAHGCHDIDRLKLVAVAYVSTGHIVFYRKKTSLDFNQFLYKKNIYIVK